MAISLVRAFVRSPTRIRLFFTADVVSAPLGAFVVGSLTPQSPDDPPVEEALILQGSQVELVLGLPMFPGGTYELHVFGGLVTAAGPSTAPEAFVKLYPSAVPTAVSSQLTIQQLSANLFGEDIAWDGSDWLEGPDGDLTPVSGPENARQAVKRRMLSSGLLWDDTYGLKPDEFIDAPAAEMPALAARAEIQALADDRIKTATAKAIGADPDEPGRQLINIDLTLIDRSTTSVVSSVTAG